MADDTERLFVQLEARITDFEKRMAKAERTGTKTYSSLRRGSKSATRQMERDMQRSTARINQALASTSSQIGLFAKSFAIGAIGGGSIAGFVTKVRGVVSELSEMGKQMDRVGLSAKALQELQFGFELAGVAQSDFITGMEQFTKRIGEASMGIGRLREILDANGVSIRRQNGEMKSTETLLREYAELIKNAGSEQERMTLATEAFGRGGASFVNALKGGEQGLRDMEKAAADAGGTIDEELVRKAEELDDRWAAMWRNFEINSKTAIMSAISYLDRFQDKMGEIGNSGFFKSLAEKMGVSDAVFVPGEGVYNPGTDELSPSARVASAFQGEIQKADADLIKALQERYGGAAETAQKRTVLPTKPGAGGNARDAAARAALREAEAVQKLIDDLQTELELVGASNAEKRTAQALRRAGAAATGEQAAQIENLIHQIERETEAQEKAKEASENRQQAIENLFQMGGDGLTSIVDGSMKAEEAIKRLAVQLALAAAQAALLGTGPLAGLLGGGGLFGLGGGGSDPWAGLRSLEGFSSGTANTGGLRGEPRGVVHGQEAVIPLPDGGKVPVLIDGGNAPAASRVEVDVGVSVNRNGNLEAFVRSVSQETSIGVTREAIDRFDMSLPDRIQEISNDPRVRG